MPRAKKKKLTAIEAASLITQAYAGKMKDKVKATFNVAGVQAFYLENGVLVIPGSNELSDYPEYNLDARKAKGDSGRLYHRGFLKHSQLVYTFAKGAAAGGKPSFVVGHSLGAASAQIVGSSFGVPTICFASPKTISGSKRVRGEGWIANYLRMDDPVCHMPPGKRSFRHIGSKYWMAPEGIDIGINHKVSNYTKIMKEARYKTKIPQAWPK